MAENDPNSVPPPPPPVGGPAPVDYATPVGAAPETNKDACMWAMFCHLSCLVGVIIPFGSVIGPLIMWQIKKKDYPFVDEQGKEALNFQITVAIALIACLILILVVIGFILLPIVGLTALVLSIIAGIKANNGEHYRYPFAIRLIK